MVATVVNILRTVILNMARTVAFEANWSSISDTRAWLLGVFSTCRHSTDSNFNCKILRFAHPGGAGTYVLIESSGRLSSVRSEGI